MPPRKESKFVIIKAASAAFVAVCGAIAAAGALYTQFAGPSDDLDNPKYVKWVVSKLQRDVENLSYDVREMRSEVMAIRRLRGAREARERMGPSCRLHRLLQLYIPLRP